MRLNQRTWELRKKDMLNSIDYIMETLKNVTKEHFYNDRTLNLAMVRSLEIIGEAAKFAPDNIRENYNKTEWRKICDMRNIIAHDYFDVDLEIAWDVLTTKIPKMKDFLEQL